MRERKYSIKKISLIILSFSIFSIVLYEVFIKYAFWQNITIPGVGTFKAPQKWIFTQKNNIIYLTDKSIEEDEYAIYLAGIIEGKEENGKINPCPIFGNIEHVGYSSYGAIYSNESRYWVETFNINGNIEEKYVIFFYNTDKTIYLMAWDNLINKGTAIKIAKSFERESNTFYLFK